MTVSVDLKVNYEVTVKDAVVEDEVGLEVVVVDEYALLAMFEAEALTKLHKELLYLVEDGGLELSWLIGNSPWEIC